MVFEHPAPPHPPDDNLPVTPDAHPIGLVPLKDPLKSGPAQEDKLAQPLPHIPPELPLVAGPAGAQVSQVGVVGGVAVRWPLVVENALPAELVRGPLAVVGRLAGEVVQDAATVHLVVFPHAAVHASVAVEILARAVPHAVELPALVSCPVELFAHEFVLLEFDVD